MRASVKLLLSVCLLASLPVLLWGQYFECNKVQYGAIDFSVLKTEHFQIYHYPEGAPAVMDAARILEAAYTHHADIFGYGIKGYQKVIVYDSFIDFEQTNVIPGIITLGEGGVTEGLMHRIVLPLTGTYRENAHVLAHELVHAFQFEKISPLGVFAAASQPLPPLWFIEGQAEYLSLGPDDPLTDMWMRDAYLNKDIPNIDDLTAKQNKYFPYRFGDAVWYWIDRGWGKTGIREFFNDAVEKGIPSAAQSALGVKTMAELSARWKGDFAITYSPKVADKTLPKDVGRILPGLDTGLNLSPVISPDGKYIAVFSHRGLFDLDLYLADAQNGKVLKSLATSESDARYDVLSFIDSAGTWSPDSRSFAFVVEQGGKNSVAIVEVPSARLEKVIPLAGVKGAAGLAWSPDGSRIALSATREALRNIYLLDPSSGALERITTGWHTKLQPAWSPDGATLAFATDEGAHTDLAALTFQSMNIGLLDIQTRQTRIISVQDGATHINPLFTPDGKALYFIADTDGYSDLYRYDFASGQFFRVTNVATGISGLTVLSPCLSMAYKTGELVMTVFNNRKYEVHAMALDHAQGQPIALTGAIGAPTLPAEITAGTPQTVPSLPNTSFTPYFPSFSLLSVSQIGVGLGVSPFGTSVGGAAAFAFGDVLGNDEFDSAIQASGSLDSIGAQFDYIDRSDRINWGVEVAHIPQQFFTSLEGPFPSGADTGILQQVIFQEEADLLAQYPLTINRRWEASVGYTLYWWEGTAPVYYYQDGVLVETDQITFATPPPLNLVHAGLAYVGDYSFFGYTSPIRGSRYRFELDGSGGSTFFLTALGDFREYLFLNPITIAFRALSVGRYLGGADNPTLSQFYLGEPDLIRGYEYYSIVANEGAGVTGNIPQLNRLFGSKIAVANLEIRIPVLGSSQFGLVNFPWLPTELVGFLDGGMAWTETDYPVLELSQDQYMRIPVFSAGAAVRVNILGAFVVQVYWAWPFERQYIGGSWGFVLESGW